MSTQTIYWHIPGLCYFGLINQVLLDTMRRYPSHFRDGYKIASCYGSFPGAIWNGGRNLFDGFSSKADVERIIAAYNKQGVPARFTWTNVLLEEKHIYDSYCNMIMRVGDNGMNQVLVNRPVLEEYIRKEYPRYKVLSSTTKRLLNADAILEEVKKDYFLVVLDYDLNHNESVINKLLPVADKIEILVNETCHPGCARRANHYVEISKHQLEFDNRIQFPCSDPTPDKWNFERVKKLPTFMSNEDIAKYIDMGYRNFKIVGRSGPKQYIIDSYLYFLVKDESRDFIRNILMSTISKLSGGK
ncbi:MAG: hypothetical protein IJL20_07295 [Lachnospiraceae bacterium]|nr:hypothetical protein [Lachnospiraceae bacterium]